MSLFGKHTSGSHAPSDSPSSMAKIRLRPALRKSASAVLRSFLVALVVCVSLGATDAAGRFETLGHRMMCTCSCAQVMLECNHVSCPVSPGMRNELSSAIAGGQGDKQILAAFVQRYGAVVLTAPPMEGFDLVAWIMPFAVALLALLGTIFLVRHWSKQQAQQVLANGGSDGMNSAEGEAMRQRIRQETETGGGQQG